MSKIKNVIDKYLLRPTTDTFVQMMRYGIVGIISFLVDVSVLLALTEIVHVPYLYSSAAAFIIGLIISYLLSIFWVFKDSRTVKPLAEFLAFSLIAVGGLLLNQAVIYFFTEHLNFHYLVSKICSTVIVFFYNFSVKKIALFNKRNYN